MKNQHHIHILSATIRVSSGLFYLFRAERAFNDFRCHRIFLARFRAGRCLTELHCVQSWMLSNILQNVPCKTLPSRACRQKYKGVIVSSVKFLFYCLPWLSCEKLNVFLNNCFLSFGHPLPIGLPDLPSLCVTSVAWSAV